MKNKICVVTGASSGIGKATARLLAGQGATVLMVCRNKQKGEGAYDGIKAWSNDGNVQLLLADLSSQDQIRKVSADIKAHHPHVDVLVNNVGAINPTLTRTIDGLETTFAVNHLSFFLLTYLLLDSLQTAPAARIVNVSSQAHRYGKINFDDPGLEKGFNPMRSYAQSKLANILFTHELARLLTGTRITVNVLHPGVVRTNFGRSLTGLAGWFFRSFGFLMRSPEKGAETVVWLATSPELDSVTGKYFFDKKEIRSSKLSYNLDVARQLWQVSVQLTDIDVEKKGKRPT